LPRGKNDIAGEVLVANHTDGSTFVQFSKSPFMLVIGQTTPKRWQVEFPSQDQRYAADGLPPKRLIWLYLPRVLRGEPAPIGWKWTDSSGNWRLANPATGEAIDGFFEQ
jgi:hypothetical protein